MTQKVERFHHKSLIFLVFPPDSKSPAARRAGSIPAPAPLTHRSSTQVRQMGKSKKTLSITSHPLRWLFCALAYRLSQCGPAGSSTLKHPAGLVACASGLGLLDCSHDLARLE
jgi:hypothetical protein